MKKLRRIFLARAATMLALAVLTTAGAWAQETKVSTTYIDANNQSQTVDAYPLNGTEEILGVEGSETPVAYVANSDINFNRGLSLACDVIFIIGDGKTVNFGTSNENRISSNAFAGQNYNLGIYCQSRGENMGKMNVYSWVGGAQVKTLTIGGGEYKIVGNSTGLFASGDVLITGIGPMQFESNSYAIISNQGNVTVRGGSIDAKTSSSSSCIQASNVSITEIDGLKLESKYGCGITYSSINGNTNCGSISISGTANSVVKINDETTSSAPAVNGRDISISADNVVVKSLSANSNISITDFSSLTINPVNGGGISAGGSLTIKGKENSVVKVNNENYISGNAISGTGNISITAHELYVGNTSSGNAITCKASITITADKIVAKGQVSVITGVSVTINAANSLTVDALNGYQAINGSNGDVTITGGQVTVTSQYAPSISAKNNINLGWTAATDFFLPSSSNNNSNSYSGTVKVANGQTLKDEDNNIYSGTLTADEVAAINGKKLLPGSAIATFAPEGYATYYASGYDLVLSEGMRAFAVTAKGADEGTLKYKTVADGDTEQNCVPAGTAVMLMVAPTEEAQTLPITIGSGAEAYSGDNLLSGSDTETLIPSTTGNAFYKLTYSEDNTTFGWYWGAENGQAFTSPAHKAWLTLPASVDARFLGLLEYETTGIAHPTQNRPSTWYTIGGMKLNGQPTAKGVYIKDGKKVVVGDKR